MLMRRLNTHARYACSTPLRSLRPSTPPASDDLQLVGYINSRLASLPASERASGGGASVALSPEMQQWEVHWADLAIERFIGSGSFRRVYAARWRETPVAVKLLLGGWVGDCRWLQQQRKRLTSSAPCSCSALLCSAMRGFHSLSACSPRVPGAHAAAGRDHARPAGGETGAALQHARCTHWRNFAVLPLPLLPPPSLHIPCCLSFLPCRRRRAWPACATPM